MPKPSKKDGPQLFTNGAGKIPDWEYGVLRARYAGRVQTTLELAAAKLGVGVDDPVWRPQRRYDVVIPPGTSDIYTDPRELWRRFEAARLPAQRDLAILLTTFMPGLAALHDGYEMARAWALQAFARERRLPVMVVQHHPAAAGSRHDPHVHLVVSARELGVGGFGAFSTLCRDKPLHALHSEWAAHRRTWTLP